MPKMTLRHFAVMNVPEVEVDPQDNIANIYLTSNDLTPVVLTMPTRMLETLRERIDDALAGKRPPTETE